MQWGVEVSLKFQADSGVAKGYMFRDRSVAVHRADEHIVREACLVMVQLGQYVLHQNLCAT